MRIPGVLEAREPQGLLGWSLSAEIINQGGRAHLAQGRVLSKQA